MSCPPGRPGVGSLSRSDQHRIDGNTDHKVTERGNAAADAPSSGTGVQDPRAKGCRGVDEASLPIQIAALSGCRDRAWRRQGSCRCGGSAGDAQWGATAVDAEVGDAGRTRPDLAALALWYQRDDQIA